MAYKYPHYPEQPHQRDNRTLTFDQMREVIELVRDRKYPNGTYSDDQCCLWEMVTHELSIDVL